MPWLVFTRAVMCSPASWAASRFPEHPHVSGGGLDQGFRSAGEQDPALVHNDQLAADRLHILNDMGGQQHQPVLGCLGKEVAEVDALLRVQAHGGLVKDEELRVSQQSLGDSHPLALASGESADSGPALLLQIDGPDDLVDGGAAVPQPFRAAM